MANKCSGKPSDQPTVRETKAYCEGRDAAAAGALEGTNPHQAGTRDELLWDNGFSSWAEDPANLPDQDCCASAPGGGYVP